MALRAAREAKEQLLKEKAQLLEENVDLQRQLGPSNGSDPTDVPQAARTFD